MSTVVRSRSARLAIVAAAVVTLAVPLAGTAGATTPADAPSSPGGASRGSAVTEAAAAKCGFFRYQVRESRFAAYGHCGSTTVRIHVDVRGGGSGNDFHLCVGPGDTMLPGAGPNYLNAYYIGGAGCPRNQRSAHTAH